MRAKLYSCKQHSSHEKYSASYKTSRIERVVISKPFDKRSFKIVKEIYLCWNVNCSRLNCEDTKISSDLLVAVQFPIFSLT